VKHQFTNMDIATPTNGTFGTVVTSLSPHAQIGDRFFVSFVVSYPEQPAIKTPEEAAAYALAMTRDDQPESTIWTVYDCQTGGVWALDQDEFEHLIDERDMLKS